MVEVRGIEPLSENLLIQLSPGAGHLLDLFLTCAGAQAQMRSNRFVRDRFNGKPPMHVHHCHDVQSRFVVLPRGTGDPQVTALPSLAPRGQRLGSHSNCIVVVYFFSLSSLRDYSALPAYCTLKSPSKPLHPHGAISQAKLQ